MSLISYDDFMGGSDLVVIAGPCAIENVEHSISVAKSLKEITERLGIKYVFKSSFDKANRTSVDSYRGPGIDEGLDILKQVKSEVGVPVVSDIHEPRQADKAAEVLDLIQIPAFLCRQTDLLVAAGKTQKIIAIKKGQFVSPRDMENALNKVKSTKNEKVLLMERGASFGYNNLVVDIRSIPIMKSFGCPVVFDATHSVQIPGGLGKSSGGAKEFVAPLAKAGVAAGADSVFLEVHDNPAAAPCDGPNMLTLGEAEQLLKTLVKIKAAVQVEKE